ncbi:MAG: PrsW family intramembrane metalloprotease [Pyrinomonadaceae bacterium]
MNDPRAIAASNPASPIRIKPSASKSIFQIIFAITAILVALLLGLIVLLLIGFETGPVALLIGLISATLPVPLYLMLVLWIDRYEAEPLWMLATAFFWGALVAVFFAYLINTASGLIVTVLTNDVSAGAAFGAVISAPIVEESAKALILLIFFFFKKDEFDGVIDGIVYAAMVGLGFAMTENIQYYGRAVSQAGGGGLTIVLIIRGALAPFAHPMFTSLTGIGLGLARQSRNPLVKIITPLFGLLAAIAMHSIWNGSAVIFGAGGFLLAYILIMVPAFFIMFIVIGLALRREGQIVREFLTPDFQSGLMNPQEFKQLGSIFGRMGASYNAFSRGGIRGWKACRQLNQTASELAFHRSRLARGIAMRDANEREAAYRMALEDLLRQLRGGGN